MKGCFFFYPEITWSTLRFLARDFKLKSFSNKDGKLKLVGSNGSVIFIDGPQARLDELNARLPECAGRPFSEIVNIRLERDFLNCKNFKTPVCNPEILDILDFAEADQICSGCLKFAPL